MKIGIVFHKDPFRPPNSIDIVRLRAISAGFIQNDIEAEIIAPVQMAGLLDNGVRVCPVRVLSQRGRYDVVKTSYHYSIELLDRYSGPVISRIVRVVDERLPVRDESNRKRLLQCQSMIRDRSEVVVLNNMENQYRWQSLYGAGLCTELIPNGCPEEIPRKKANPYLSHEKVILFLGSVAAPRMVDMLNQAVHLLAGRARIHLVGLNKASMYGAGKDYRLDPLIVNHGELIESETWNYIYHAHVGLALATCIDAFDNDISKIVNYLRGGLPVLSEAPILNNDMILRAGYGKVFRYGDVEDLVVQCKELIDNPPTQKKDSVMDYMIREHGWRQRVNAYVRLFQSISNKKFG
jgi:glycosyltransferase involved in cell wall biosynthesis